MFSLLFQDLEDDEYDVRKPKKQRRSIVRTPSITRVRVVNRGVKHRKLKSSVWEKSLQVTDGGRGVHRK